MEENHIEVGQKPKYPIIMRIMHWLMGIMIIAMLAVGLLMEDAPDDIRGQIYGLHKSFGVVLLILFLTRLQFRIALSRRVPPLPNSLNKMDKFLAHIGHFLLYAFMLAMPVSGYLMSNAAGYPVSMFGVELPNIVEKSKALNEITSDIHEYAGLALIAVILGHIAGVIKHRYFDKDDILYRMT